MLMLRKIIFILALLISCSVDAFAQQQYTIGGTAADSTSKESVIGAIVTVSGTNNQG